MAEGFELYHIPQQSRREKLRVLLQNHHTSGYVGDLQGCAGLGLLPFFNFSSSQNLLSCANVKASLMAPDSSYNSSSNASEYRTGRAIMDNSSNESSDLQSVRDSGHDHCHSLNRHQDLRFFQHHDQAPFHGGDFVALSLSSQPHSGISPVGLHLQTCGGDIGGDFRRSAVMTIGPYTGYASILKGSKFLKPAQHLLDEICDVGFGIYAEKFDADCSLMDDPPPFENLRTSVDDPSCGGIEMRKKSSLISLLDEVYCRYKQYYQQIQAVITSFETVAGLNSAAPFAYLDIKAMSKHFQNLKNAITEQLQFPEKNQQRHLNYGNKEFLWSKMAVGNMGFVEHRPVWRPQRGLPKRAVKVLRSWLFDHFLHPYPTDTDKQLLAKQTGLSRNQVSNWFINARVRVWKPMVEEVHRLETRHRILPHIQQQETSCLGNSNSSVSMNQGQEPLSKRARNHFSSGDNNDQHIMEGNKKHMNFHDNFSTHCGNIHTSGNRGVPLMLGLGQNNNVFTSSEKFPLNADGGGERFVIGGLNAQSRHFGREIIGGRNSHDFGG